MYLLLCANFKCQSLVISAIDGSSLLQTMPGAVRTVSSFSRAASSWVCGPCRTSSYCTWSASDRYCCGDGLAWPVMELRHPKCLNFRMEIDEWRFRTWWSSLSSVWTWHHTWWREARAAGVSLLTGHHGDGLMGWAETQRTTFMTCMQCAITMGPCKEDITQVTGSEHPGLCVCCWLTGLIVVVCCSIAHCKNSIDGQWYCFDDSDVHPISEDDVCKQTGYILFYQRRATVPSWSANSSVGGNCLVWWRISGVLLVALNCLHHCIVIDATRWFVSSVSQSQSHP